MKIVKDIENIFPHFKGDGRRQRVQTDLAMGICVA